MVFDDPTLRRMLHGNAFGLTLEQFVPALHGASQELLRRIWQLLMPEQRVPFIRVASQPATQGQVACARRQVLDSLFWELTYWKTPDLYDQLTEGEYLHPGIFADLEPAIRDKTVLDIGAGSGRASFECLRHGAARIYAVEPSPGLLRILRQKLQGQEGAERIIVRSGSFDAIPLEENSVDVVLSCSAFTAAPEQGGEPGLAEMWRVVRAGGKMVIIWPCVRDRAWLLEHGFQYVALPVEQEMYVHFRSLESALACMRRFYAHNEAAMQYILSEQRPEAPFSLLGINPPCDYCWRVVQKEP
jgi:ubiquinone/menaquinone biosynthesis C-methylase UbiE